MENWECQWREEVTKLMLLPFYGAGKFRFVTYVIKCNSCVLPGPGLQDRWRDPRQSRSFRTETTAPIWFATGPESARDTLSA